jgi:hypothetical protein
MRNDRYRSRLIDEKIDNYLKAFGAICIEGPKWCGKTWTSEHHAEFDGKLYHYQDYKGREIDAVIELPDGNWCGFEIKLGAGEIDASRIPTIQSMSIFRHQIPQSDPSFRGSLHDHFPDRTSPFPNHFYHT